MLKENISMLRNVNGYSIEQVAERMDVPMEFIKSVNTINVTNLVSLVYFRIQAVLKNVYRTLILTRGELFRDRNKLCTRIEW